MHGSELWAKTMRAKRKRLEIWESLLLISLLNKSLQFHSFIEKLVVYFDYVHSKVIYTFCVYWYLSKKTGCCWEHYLPLKLSVEDYLFFACVFFVYVLRISVLLVTFRVLICLGYDKARRLLLFLLIIWFSFKTRDTYYYKVVVASMFTLPSEMFRYFIKFKASNSEIAQFLRVIK